MASQKKADSEMESKKAIATRRYIFVGDEERAIANAKIIGVNSIVEGASLMQLAIANNQFGIAKRLFAEGATFEKGDRMNMLDNIRHLRGMINTLSYKWTQKQRVEVQSRLDGMEELVAASQRRR